MLIAFTVSSFIAGVITASITQPFWVLQTKLTETKVLNTVSSERSTENVAATSAIARLLSARLDLACSPITRANVPNPPSRLAPAQNHHESLCAIIRQLGIRGLYSGLSSSLMLVVNPIISFLVYEYLKQYYGTNQLMIFVSGGLSKFIATSVTYPYQILRTRLIQDPSKSHLQLFREILLDGGFCGLYRGFKPKIIQSVINQAFLFLFYEEILSFTQTLQKNSWKFSQNQGNPIRNAVLRGRRTER